MICPRCKLGTLREEGDMVVCSSCGFEATLREYNVWRKVHEVKPRVREKTVLNGSEGTYTEARRNNEEAFDKRLKTLALLAALAILILLALELESFVIR